MIDWDTSQKRPLAPVYIMCHLTNRILQSRPRGVASGHVYRCHVGSSVQTGSRSASGAFGSRKELTNGSFWP